jgi:hypothetical protein
MQECFRVGLIWQGIIHDLSKYSITEFFGSAKYFQGNKTPIEAEKAELGYSTCWLHHKGHNKHHWEYWIDWKEDKQYCAPIPSNYILEMACDMIGAAKAYNKKAFNKDDPIKYFSKNEKKFALMGENMSLLKSHLEGYALTGKLLNLKNI